ncbi:MAG: DUF3098 domain-containing protein [Saprospiraceae bacterium]
MAKESTPNKKVIKTEPRKTDTPSGASMPLPGRKKVITRMTNTPTDFTFNRENIKWMLISVGIVSFGYILMMGGKMPSNNVWDEKIIYSFTRTVLAPVVILAGLGLSIYAIFLNKPSSENNS